MLLFITFATQCVLLLQPQDRASAHIEVLSYKEKYTIDDIDANSCDSFYLCKNGKNMYGAKHNNGNGKSKLLLVTLMPFKVLRSADIPKCKSIRFYDLANSEDVIIICETENDPERPHNIVVYLIDHASLSLSELYKSNNRIVGSFFSFYCLSIAPNRFVIAQYIPEVQDINVSLRIHTINLQGNATNIRKSIATIPLSLSDYPLIDQLSLRSLNMMNQLMGRAASRSSNEIYILDYHKKCVTTAFSTSSRPIELFQLGYYVCALCNDGSLVVYNTEDASSTPTKLLSFTGDVKLYLYMHGPANQYAILDGDNKYYISILNRKVKIIMLNGIVHQDKIVAISANGSAVVLRQGSKLVLLVK